MALAVIDANKKLQNGESQNMDECILQGIDGQALGNLTPAPQAICSIGLIMCVSLKRDFELIEKGGKLPELVRNNSFRATLVQVSGEAHDAFMEAHGNMQQLSMWMGSIPDHMKNSVKFLVNADGMSQRQMSRHLTTELESVSAVGVKALSLAEQTYDKFAHVGQLLQVVMELLVTKQGVSQQKREDARREAEIQETRKKELGRMMKDSGKEFGELDKQLKEAQVQGIEYG